MTTTTTGNAVEQPLFVAGACTLNRRDKSTKVTSLAVEERAVEKDLAETARSGSITRSVTAGGLGLTDERTSRFTSSSSIASRRQSLASRRRHRVRSECSDVTCGGGLAAGRAPVNLSAISLFCSGKNCLESAPEWSAVKTGRTLGKRAELPLQPKVADNSNGRRNELSAAVVNEGGIFSSEPNRHRYAMTSIETTNDPLVGDLCGFRKARICWNDEMINNRSSETRSTNRKSAAAAAEITARRHIWACQLPGSVKRSSRVAHGLSALMTTLRDDDDDGGDGGGTERRINLNLNVSFSSSLAQNNSDRPTGVKNTAMVDYRHIQSSPDSTRTFDSNYCLVDHLMALNAAIPVERSPLTNGQYSSRRPSTPGRTSAPGRTTPRRHMSVNHVSTTTHNGPGQPQTTAAIEAVSVSKASVPD